MKVKNIIITLLTALVIVVALNLYLTNITRNHIYNAYAKVINIMSEKNPELVTEVIKSFKESSSNKDILKSYGIDTKTINILNNYQNYETKIICITVLSFLSITLIFLSNYIFTRIKIKKEINTINSYLNTILQGVYDLNIADYNEDEISILKNDIYKVAIKLKEYSEYELKENKYLVSFLEDISHQLKTPLTALIVTNDILSTNELTTSERNNFLNKQTKELEKMDWLIATLLKYSKLDSGSIKLKEEKIKASNLIAEVIESLSIPIELKEAEITIENLDYSLICDINWTKEALTNILKNACEHIPSKGEITIRGENNPLYKSITITDYGCGISKKDIKNIFKRFYSSNSNKNSIGIGLNMSKLIIEKQKGKIEVESELGKYTTFKIIFFKKWHNCNKESHFKVTNMTYNEYEKRRKNGNIKSWKFIKSL